VCTSCGEKVGSDEQDQELLDAVHSAYRREKDLISPSEIKEIRKRWKLSQRAFALLLGMGEVTITRYENGQLQDAAHDTAIRACEDADFVRNLLMRRGHLLSKRQRDKVQRALADDPEPNTGVDLSCFAGHSSREPSPMNGFRRFDYARFATVVLWFCRRFDGVWRTSINKLLFYADFLNFDASAISLTGSEYRRLQYGPVPADYGRLLDRMEAEGLVICEEVPCGSGLTGFRYRAEENRSPATVELGDYELKVLQHVAQTVGELSASAISERSHQEEAWRKTGERELIDYGLGVSLSMESA
jgi:putative zinc finger/helix-turn-helix YgiT family protein